MAKSVERVHGDTGDAASPPTPDLWHLARGRLCQLAIRYRRTNASTTVRNRAGSVACTSCPASIVIARPPGILAARSASWFCGRWLALPPATTSVLAAMRGNWAHHSGSGPLR